MHPFGMISDMDRNRLFTASGFLVALILGGGSIISILLYPEWSITSNSFSDLGDSMSPSKVLFNTACVIAGIFQIIFAVGYVLYGRKMSRIGGAIMAADGVILILVGVISKEVSFDMHLTVSMLFAAVFLAGAAFICIQDVLEGHWRYILPVALAGLAVGIVWILYLMLGEANIPYGIAQIASFGAAFVWFICETLKNSREGFASTGIKA